MKKCLLYVYLFNLFFIAGCFQNSTQFENKDFEYIIEPGSVNISSFETEEDRIFACEEMMTSQLNFDEGSYLWEDEDANGNEYVRSGVVEYKRWGGKSRNTVLCKINILDGSVNVGSLEHVYLGEVD